MVKQADGTDGASTSAKRVVPYPDAVRPKKRLDLETYEYEMPFNYENVEVVRGWKGGEQHGVEMNPTNSLCLGPEHLPADAIVIAEEHPIVRVEVIGSACNPPGFVTLEAEPIEGWRRPGEVAEVMPVRFRADNLWGMHLRVDQWARHADGDFAPHSRPDRYPRPEDLPEPIRRRNLAMKATAWEFPLAGMSCAVFAIPPSRKVYVSGGGTAPGWRSDNNPDDVQYSFRTVRVTVARDYTP